MSKHEEVLIALRQIIRATDIYSRKLSKEAGLTSPQLLILNAIKEKGPITMGTLAQEISLSQATTTTILDRLEKRGLVERKRSEQDRRRVFASLTAQGKQTIEQAPTPLQHDFIDQFEQLKDWEQSLILSSLQRVATMMNAEQLEASPLLDIGSADRAQPVTAVDPTATPSQSNSQ